MAQMQPHLHVPHPHVSLKGDDQGSPWMLLPGVALALAAVIAVLTIACFLIALSIAGRAY
jgi:hypothetical protein